MPLIVEDGTLPAGANSFADLAEADAYHAARLRAAWTGEVTDAQKEAALIRASDWLNRKVTWAGHKISGTQRMAWPRLGVATHDGAIPADEIPAQVVDACCELAGFFVEQDYLAPLDRGGDIASLNVAVISIAYNSKESIKPSIGRCKVTGQISAYFEDSYLLDKFINEASSSLVFTLTDGEAGNAMKFTIPKIKYTGGQPDVGDEGPITLSMPFQALLDPGTDATLKIERIPA